MPKYADGFSLPFATSTMKRCPAGFDFPRCVHLKVNFQKSALRPFKNITPLECPGAVS